MGIRKYSILFLAALLGVCCGKEPASNEQQEETKEVQCNLHGFAQKGQFVKGSQVTAFAVGADMVATGESFPSNISDDLGSFAITGKTEAPYLELRAEGYYFNEISGSVSSSPLYLEAFVKSDDTAANINLMTTAIRPRVKKLISGGKSYSDAVSQAQKELLASLSFAGTAGNFDDMDITGTTDADAMLLAFACLVQQDRSASEVTTLIQEIASNLESDGALGAKTVDAVMQNKRYIQPFQVIRNMAEYYREKSLSISTVPLFFNYLDSGFNGKFQVIDEIYADITGPLTNPDAVGGTYSVLSTIDFTVTTDVPGVTVEKEHILGPAYIVSWYIPENDAQDERTTTFSFKSADGEILYEATQTQGANVQYLIIRNGARTKSIVEGTFSIGDEISVNGSNFTIKGIEAFGGEPGVKVPKAESYVVSYPAGVVSGGGHIARAKLSVSAEDGMSPVMPYYGALAPYQDFPVGNPGQVMMFPCLAALGFRIGDTYKSIWAYIEVAPNADNEFLAGSASFVVNENDKYYFSDLNPDISFENGIRTKRINNDGGDETAFMLTFPQTLSSGFSVKLYAKDGSVLFENSVSREIQLSTGSVFVLSIN